MNTAHEFTNRLRDLLRRENAALAEFLVELAAFDAKRLWVDLGHASLFAFLHVELRLSKGAAFYRNTAVGLLHRFPAIVEPLRDGRLCLMTVAEVAKVLTPENRAEVLPLFFGLSKREAQALAARLQPDPVPPMREVVTPIRAPAAPALALATVEPIRQVVAVPVQPVELELDAAQAPRVAPRPAPAPPAEVRPLTAELNRVHVTLSRRVLDKLDAARDALSHSHPNASFEEILEVGLDLVLERQAKRRGLVKKPRALRPPASDPDGVPAHVRRAVFERDGARCRWKLANGGVCGSTRRVELDHVIVRARGGAPTAENLRCLCRFHNDLAAREVFGDAWMDRYTRSPRTAPPAAAPTPGA